MIVSTANTDWARRGDASYLAWLCDRSDVLLLQEVKDVRLGKVLPAGWRSLQDTSDQGRMGACIAVREKTVKVNAHGIALGCEPIIAGHRIRMLVRWIAWAELENKSTGGKLSVISAHFPPARFRALQPGYLRRLRGVVERAHNPVVIGTDANQPVSRVAAALHMNAHAQGIVGLITAKSLGVSDVQVHRWGIAKDVTDHPSVTAHVHRGQL